MPPESRALAAALAPARRTLPALLPQCRTFSDQAWAHTSALVEERVAAVLERTGSWWESEDQDAEPNVGTSPSTLIPPFGLKLN
jgi:hypothetical protein